MAFGVLLAIYPSRVVPLVHIMHLCKNKNQKCPLKPNISPRNMQYISVLYMLRAAWLLFQFSDFYRKRKTSSMNNGYLKTVGFYRCWLKTNELRGLNQAPQNRNKLLQIITIVVFHVYGSEYILAWTFSQSVPVSNCQLEHIFNKKKKEFAILLCFV